MLEYGGPFRVLREIGSNTYELDIPRDFGINLILNIEGLTQNIMFKSTFQLHSKPDIIC